MTGTAFASYERRGTLCTGWLRRITYIILNRARVKVVAGCIRREAGGFMLGVVLRAKTRPRRAKTRPTRAETHSRRRQDAPRRS